MNRAKPTLDQILHQLQKKVPSPTVDTAVVWGNRYPAYRREITEFVSEWMFQSIFGDEPASFNEDRAHMRASSDFQNALFNYRLHGDTLPGLKAAAQHVNLDPADLAKMVRANIDFLEALEKRLVASESIPGTFLTELANALQVHPRLILNWMVSGGVLRGARASGLRKVKGKRRFPVKSFEDVWRDCQLREDDLDHWKQ